MAVLFLKPQSTQRKYTQRAQREDVHSVTQSQRDSLRSQIFKTNIPLFCASALKNGGALPAPILLQLPCCHQKLTVNSTLRYSHVD